MRYARRHEFLTCPKENPLSKFLIWKPELTGSEGLCLCNWHRSGDIPHERELEHACLNWGQALVTKPHVRRMPPHLYGPASRLFKKRLGTAAFRKHSSLGNQSLTKLMQRGEMTHPTTPPGGSTGELASKCLLQTLLFQEAQGISCVKASGCHSPYCHRRTPPTAQGARWGGEVRRAQWPKQWPLNMHFLPGNFSTLQNLPIVGTQNSVAITSSATRKEKGSFVPKRPHFTCHTFSEHHGTPCEDSPSHEATHSCRSEQEFFPLVSYKGRAPFSCISISLHQNLRIQIVPTRRVDTSTSIQGPARQCVSIVKQFTNIKD